MLFSGPQKYLLAEGKTVLNEPLLFEELPENDQNNLKLQPDYVTITFKSHTDREGLFLTFQELLGEKIPTHQLDVYRKIQPPPKKGTIYALFETNGKSDDNTQYELSFPGRGAQTIIRLFFAPSILEYARHSRAKLKRFDLCLEASCNEKEDLSEAFSFFQSQQKKYENAQKHPRTIKSTLSQEGDIICIEPKNVTHKVKIYVKKKKNNPQSFESAQSNLVRCELELRTASLKNLTQKWLCGKKKDFLIESLILYTKYVGTLVTTPLTEHITKKGLPSLKNWLQILDPNSNKEKFTKASITRIKVQDEGKTSFILSKSFYPVYLAIFQRTMLLWEEQQPQGQFYNLTFSFENLLSIIGWPQTRHFQRKLVAGIIQLEKVSFVVENRNSRVFYQFITNSRIRKREKTVELKLNLALLRDLKTSNTINPMYFANIVRSYQSYFKSNVLPALFYPLVSQTFEAITKDVVFHGPFPKNSNSAKHLLELVNWIFCNNYIQTNILEKVVKVDESKQSLSYILPTGSFWIDKKRSRLKKPEKPENFKEFEKLEKPEKPENFKEFEKLEKLEKPEKPENFKEFEEFEKPENFKEFEEFDELQIKQIIEIQASIYLKKFEREKSEITRMQQQDMKRISNEISQFIKKEEEEEKEKEKIAEDITNR